MIVLWDSVYLDRVHLTPVPPFFSVRGCAREHSSIYIYIYIPQTVLALWDSQFLLTPWPGDLGLAGATEIPAGIQAGISARKK